MTLPSERRPGRPTHVHHLQIPRSVERSDHVPTPEQQEHRVWEALISGPLQVLELATRCDLSLPAATSACSRLQAQGKLVFNADGNSWRRA